jgi:hypothetical protein
MSDRLGVRTGRTTRSTIQAAAAVVGVVFLLVGVLGFIPGITTSYDSMEAAGHRSHAELLGIFQVSGLAMARTVSGARAYLIGGGAIYLVLWLYGLVIDKTSEANFVPVNVADDWLHFVLGLGMVGLGVALGRNTTLGR